MKKRKKSWIIFFMLVMSLVITAVTVSCFNPKHIHTYSFDENYHWVDCCDCNTVTAKSKHSIQNNGVCSVCKAPSNPTEGIIYELSNNTANVTGYNGTAKLVRIAETYEGKPVTKIASEAFLGAEKITGIIIPDSITTIEACAFYRCSSLTSITIPDSVTFIGYAAFRCCYKLTSVTLPNSITSIPNSLFLGCGKLKNISIPDSVTSIGDGAFSSCNSLTSITIPDGVTYIGWLAFDDCSSLTSIVIGGSVTYIGDSAFEDCDNLTNVYYKGTAKEWQEVSIDYNNNELTSATRYYYSESEPALNNDGTAYNGNFWKYGANGEVVVWEYKPE